MVKKTVGISKIIAILVLIVLMSNFTMPTVVLATGNLEVTDNEKQSRENPNFSKSVGKDILNDGVTRVDNDSDEKEEIGVGGNALEFVVGLFLSVWSLIRVAQSFILNALFVDTTTKTGEEAITKKAEAYRI